MSENTAVLTAAEGVPEAAAAADCKATSIAGRLGALAAAVEDGAENFTFGLGYGKRGWWPRLFGYEDPEPDVSIVGELQAILAPKGYCVELITLVYGETGSTHWQCRITWEKPPATH